MAWVSRNHPSRFSTSSLPFRRLDRAGRIGPDPRANASGMHTPYRRLRDDDLRRGNGDRGRVGNGPGCLERLHLADGEHYFARSWLHGGTYDVGPDCFLSSGRAGSATHAGDERRLHRRFGRHLRDRLDDPRNAAQAQVRGLRSSPGHVAGRARGRECGDAGDDVRGQPGACHPSADLLQHHWPRGRDSHEQPGTGVARRGP